jgi:uncharacterized membrane protein YedE/YeeE
MLPAIWPQALFGGALIGAAAALLMLGLGRIAGITGIVGGLLPPAAPDRLWRVLFLAGLLAGPALAGALLGHDPVGPPAAGLPVLALAGLLVGFGTGIGGGCTSGHGICGLARLSPRSLAATLVFMLAGGATVFAVRHLGG